LAEPVISLLVRLDAVRLPWTPTCITVLQDHPVTGSQITWSFLAPL